MKEYACYKCKRFFTGDSQNMAVKETLRDKMDQKINDLLVYYCATCLVGRTK